MHLPYIEPLFYLIPTVTLEGRQIGLFFNLYFTDEKLIL